LRAWPDLIPKGTKPGLTEQITDRPGD